MGARVRRARRRRGRRCPAAADPLRTPRAASPCTHESDRRGRAPFLQALLQHTSHTLKPRAAPTPAGQPCVEAAKGRGRRSQTAQPLPTPCSASTQLDNRPASADPSKRPQAKGSPAPRWAIQCAPAEGRGRRGPAAAAPRPPLVQRMPAKSNSEGSLKVTATSDRQVRTGISHKTGCLRAESERVPARKGCWPWAERRSATLTTAAEQSLPAPASTLLTHRGCSSPGGGGGRGGARAPPRGRCAIKQHAEVECIQAASAPATTLPMACTAVSGGGAELPWPDEACRHVGGKPARARAGHAGE